MRDAIYPEQVHFMAPAGTLDTLKTAAREEGQTAWSMWTGGRMSLIAAVGHPP